MRIKITDKWLLTSDSSNFIINEVTIVQEGKTKGEKKVSAVGFYPTLPQAIEALLTKNMLESTADNLIWLRNEHTAFVDHVKGLFKELP